MTELTELNPEDVAAAYLRISVRTLQQARWDEEVAAECYLPAHIKVGRRVFYERAELEAVKAARLAHPKLARRFQQETQHDAVA